LGHETLGSASSPEAGNRNGNDNIPGGQST
jgi:hypothetical protein